MTSFDWLSLFVLFSANSWAQTSDPYLGLHFGKVPDFLYTHVPQLPKNQGILVEDVNQNSSAWLGGLRRYDVILSVDAKPMFQVQDAEEKLRTLKPDQSVEMSIFRGGREMILSFDAHRKQNAAENEYLTPKGFLKRGGPPAVTIQFQPLEEGKLNFLLSFYSDQSGKLERLTYTGQLGDIEKQIQTDAKSQRLPDRVQDLVEVALKRVRTLNKHQK